MRFQTHGQHLVSVVGRIHIRKTHHSGTTNIIIATSHNHICLAHPDFIHGFFKRNSCGRASGHGMRHGPIGTHVALNHITSHHVNQGLLQHISLALPVENAQADIIMFMSVFTHLKPDEIKTYLAEAFRVLKPGGRIVASYIDPDATAHKHFSLPALMQVITRAAGRNVMLTRTPRVTLSQWMEEAGFTVERAITDKSLGQHALIAAKSTAARA